ncbi:MAG: HD domain-containing protein [Longimicrobiales bacterium]|nr:HD domain-containing protein [Longimicrobiales bacterium]
MKEASEFLTAFVRCVSTLSLYHEGHPALEKVLSASHERLQRLQEVEPTPHFTFLGGEVLLGRRPLRELRAWEWSRRLADAGIQRVECLGPVTRDDLDAFTWEVHARLAGETGSTAEQRQGRPSMIRYGSVGVKGGEEGPAPIPAATAMATLGYDLREEINTVEWLHAELREGRSLQIVEAEAIVRSLAVAMHGDQDFVLPLLRLKEFDQYTTTHAMNVSILAMSLAEFIGLAPREVRTFGISGLLHDLGKVTIPDEILNKPGRLTDEERAVMNNHTIAGARLILESEEHLDLAAVVAYEHHIKLDGGGYPSLTWARRCHQASDMVHVCDVFDALRTHRPYREAWEQSRVLGYLEEGAGTEFDSELVRAFVQMIRTWGDRITEIAREDQPVIGGAEGQSGRGGTLKA